MDLGAKDMIQLFVAFLLALLLSRWLLPSTGTRDTPVAIPSFSHASDDYKMVLLIRTDLGMSKGKVAAQCCHATLAAYKSATKGNEDQRRWLYRWEAFGQAKITLKVDSEQEMYPSH
jgi:hypothetical protein